MLESKLIHVSKRGLILFNTASKVNIWFACTVSNQGIFQDWLPLRWQSTNRDLLNHLWVWDDYTHLTLYLVSMAVQGNHWRARISRLILQKRWYVIYPLINLRYIHQYLSKRPTNFYPMQQIYFVISIAFWWNEGGHGYNYQHKQCSE